MKIYDCFTFYNELDLLEIRLHQLWDKVDYFVIVEGDLTYAGKKKDSQYLLHQARYSWAKSKTIHVIATLLEHPETRWVNEALQRDAISLGLGNAAADDIICISCVDEIYSDNVFNGLSSGSISLPVLVELDLYYYYLNGRCTGSSKIFPCPVITICSKLGGSVHDYWDNRYSYSTFPKGGWHFSFLGGAELIREKIEAYSHDEYDDEHYKNVQSLETAIESGGDLFNREGVTDVRYVLLDSSFPSYLLDNVDKYSHLIKYTDKSITSNLVFDQYSRYKACADICVATGIAAGESVLDVGSGPDCVLGYFLPDAMVHYIDPLIPDGAGASRLSGSVFANKLDEKSFDCVTAIDVLDHISPEQRSSFLQRVAALASKTLIISFPVSASLDELSVEEVAGKYSKSSVSAGSPANISHREFVLPSLEETTEHLKQMGWHCQSIGHGHVPWRQTLLGLFSSMSNIPGAEDIELNISDEFNNTLYQHDFRAPFYRQIIIASRADLGPISLIPEGNSDIADAAFSSLLMRAYRLYNSRYMLAQSKCERITNELNAVVLERDQTKAELDVIKAERDVEIGEKDLALITIADMKKSLSWRLTMPLRFSGRIFRYGLIPEDRQRLSRAFRKYYHRLPLPRSVKKLNSFLYYGVFRRFLRTVRRIFLYTPKFQAPSLRPAAQVAGTHDYIVWGVIDWNFRHQRPQQLAIEIADLNRRVFYISPAAIDDARNGFDVESLDSSGRLFQVRLYVAGAPAIYSSAPDSRVVNQLRLSIGEVLDWADCNRIISLVEHPYWYDITYALPNSRLIYDCMDHHDGFGNNSGSLVELERKLFTQSSLTITTSIWLECAVAKYSPHRVMIRNAGAYDHFSHTPANIFHDPQGRKIIGYYGAIAEWFDQGLVKAIAHRFLDCCVLLIGADTINLASRLGKLPNVIFTGEVPYNQLPYYLHSFDVCLLPFKVVPLTLATNPVKAYEYLSAGKPVVAVDLPEMSQFEGMINIAADHASFLDEVERVLSQPDSPEMIEQRKKFASENTWSHRAKALVQHAEDSETDPLVSVVVVTYNNIDLTRACLASLDEHSLYENLEIIVVDNASSDGTPEFLEDWVSRGVSRKLVLNQDNRGFAAANNQGLVIATGEYLVMLNNDTYVTPGWVRTLVNHLKHDDGIGLIGPVTNNIGNEAKIDITYGDMSDMIVKSAAYTRRHIGETCPLRTAAFFCVMLSRNTFEKVGELDEVFGRGFFEDDDYCRRVEAQGLRIVCAEDVFIHHHLSASFNLLKQKDRQALFEENKKIYEAKWGEWVPHGYRKIRQAVPLDRTVPCAFSGQFYLEGDCVICGKPSRFFYQDESLWRESLNCSHCRTTSRYRSIATGVLRAINELMDVGATSLSSLPDIINKKLHVYDTQPPFYYETCAYPLPDLLKKAKWIEVRLSQFKPNLPAGSSLACGVTNQNLECLTYDDASLDLVITSDVMEHVRLDDRAHHEIHRVLKPGGIYIFTVPHNRALDETLVRVQVNDPDDASKDVYLLEPEYHGDTNSDEGGGVLSYRVYGRDLEEYLADLGFDVEYVREDFEHLGIMNTELYYCRKLPV